MKTKTLGLLALGLLFGQPTLAAYLIQDGPVPTIYTEGAGNDFAVEGTGLGMGYAAGSLQAVDLFLPPGAVNSSTSGCEAADFAGFAAGNIALMQRGTCAFEIKVHNAFMAGAIGALIFNEGQAGRTDALVWGCAAGFGFFCEIPSLFLSFDVGNNLASLLATGADVRMRMYVPEPGTLALLGLGLAGLGLSRRRKA